MIVYQVLHPVRTLGPFLLEVVCCCCLSVGRAAEVRSFAAVPPGIVHAAPVSKPPPETSVKEGQHLSSRLCLTKEKPERNPAG